MTEHDAAGKPAPVDGEILPPDAGAGEAAPTAAADAAPAEGDSASANVADAGASRRGRRRGRGAAPASDAAEVAVEPDTASAAVEAADGTADDSASAPARTRRERRRGGEVEGEGPDAPDAPGDDGEAAGTAGKARRRGKGGETGAEAPDDPGQGTGDASEAADAAAAEAGADDTGAEPQPSATDGTEVSAEDGAGDGADGDREDDEEIVEHTTVAKVIPLDDPAQQMRLIEALLFASATTLDEKALAERLPKGADVEGLLARLAEQYAGRGVNLIKVAGGYVFRTASDLAQMLQIEKVVQRKLSRAAVETIAIIAYHQPVTRAEIEQIRGVGLSKGTLDLLFEQNWIQPLGRRRAPGKPVTWGTTDFFLEHFGLGALDDLPGLDELKAAGLLDIRSDVQIYRPDEPDLPLTDDGEEGDEPLSDGEPPAPAAEPAAPAPDGPGGEDDEPKAA